MTAAAPLAITDPTAAPTYGDGPLSRWCKAALYDPRDEVFVRLTLKVIASWCWRCSCSSGFSAGGWSRSISPSGPGTSARHPHAPLHDAPPLHPAAQVARARAPLRPLVPLRHPRGLRRAPHGHASRRGQHAGRCPRRCASVATASSISSPTARASFVILSAHALSDEEATDDDGAESAHRRPVHQAVIVGAISLTGGSASSRSRSPTSSFGS